MARLEESSPAGKTVGLVVGLCGFLGVLAAPWLATSWAQTLRWVLPIFIVAGLILLSARRRRKISVPAAALLLCLSVLVLLAPTLSAMQPRF
jgi:MFS family permease